MSVVFFKNITIFTVGMDLDGGGPNAFPPLTIFQAASRHWR